ncbi:MAG: DMT family transporter [Desulfobacterales bacterium]|nr:DMT family transporter [Desulfobacterales bacterium]
MPTRRSAKFFLSGLSAAILFGAATPASKLLLTEFHPQVLAGLLYLGAVLGVLPAVVRKTAARRMWRADRRTLGLLVAAIVTGGIVGPLLLLIALQRASAGSVSLWLNLEFVATILLGHFIFREYLTARGWIAAAGTLLAAVLLAGGEGAPGLPAILLVAGACLCWGLDNHLTALIDGISPAQTTLWKGLVAGGFNLTLGVLRADGIGSPGPVVGALFVGAVAYGLSVAMYIAAAQGLGASRSQMVFSTAPFFGLLLSVALLGEPLTGTQAGAALLTAASLAVVFSEKHRHFHRHAAHAHRHPHDHEDRHHAHDHTDARHLGDPTHWHEHEPVEHEHAHWPDLHHRHQHPDDDKGD